MTHDQVNEIIEACGVSTRDISGLYATITDTGKIRIEDANNYTDLPADTDADGIAAFVKGWAEAVGY